MAVGWLGLEADLYLETDEPHQFEAVAFCDDAFLQFEVELHLSVFDFILKVDVVQTLIFVSADIGQSQIVGAEKTDGSACEKSAYDAFGPGETIFGVCSLGSSSRRGGRERGDVFRRDRRYDGGG